jgi:hypothetical protein
MTPGEVAALYTRYLAAVGAVEDLLCQAEAEAADARAAALAAAERTQEQCAADAARLTRQRAEVGARYEKAADKLTRYGADMSRRSAPADKGPTPSLQEALKEFDAALAGAEAAMEEEWRRTIRR